MAEPDDKDLVVAARGGDRKAFSTLVARNKRRVFHTAFQLLGSEADAEDVAQEAFVRAFRAIGDFDGRSRFSTWMYRITVNTSLNHLRKRDRQKQVSLDAYPLPARIEAESASDEKRRLELRALWTDVAQAVNELNEDLKVVLVLGQLQGLTQAEIAEVLEIAEGTVAWRLHQARKKLREALGSALDTLSPPRPKDAEKPTEEEAPEAKAEPEVDEPTEKEPLKDFLAEEEAAEAASAEATPGEEAEPAPEPAVGTTEESTSSPEPAKEAAPAGVKETDAAKSEEEADPGVAAEAAAAPAEAEAPAEEAEEKQPEAGAEVAAAEKAEEGKPAETTPEEKKPRRRTRKKKSEADLLAQASAEMDIASMTSKRRRKKGTKKK